MAKKLSRIDLHIMQGCKWLPEGNIPPYLLRQDAIKDYFSGWNVITCATTVTPANHLWQKLAAVKPWIRLLRAKKAWLLDQMKATVRSICKQNSTEDRAISLTLQWLIGGGPTCRYEEGLADSRYKFKFTIPRMLLSFMVVVDVENMECPPFVEDTCEK